jgi:hypothetical protein
MRLCVTLRTTQVFVLSSSPAPVLEEHFLSAVCDCVKSFVVTLHIWRRSPASETSGIPSFTRVLFKTPQCHELFVEWARIWTSSQESCDGRATAQAVSRRLPTAEARVRAQVRSCGICGGQNCAGACFLRVLRFPLPILIPSTNFHSIDCSTLIIIYHPGQIQ